VIFFVFLRLYISLKFIVMPRSSKLNDAQLKLVQMFEFASTPKEENELMSVLRDYYIKRFSLARKRVMSTGRFSAAEVDSYVKSHQHGKPVK
jgi:hypothetical protein